MARDLDKIKKYYGEDMSHFCRKYFSTILEEEGLLYDLISKSFAPNKYLYEDLVKYSQIINFIDYIESLIAKEEIEYDVTETPQELLNKVGYKLYECHTIEDILSFTKYYEKEEEICTFKEPRERLRDNYVYFIVKENIESIKREDFSEPFREDEYGTSVMSIQIDKITNKVSIKNRYNHTVFNPDATYENNLDNIVKGLKKSFENELGIEIDHVKNKGYFEFIGYKLSSDGKYHKCNYNINNIYYGPNNTIIDNYHVVTKYQQNEKYLVFDYFVIDLEKKTIELYDKSINDSFSKIHKNISKIEIKKEEDKKYIYLTIGKEIIIIALDKLNRMIYYENNSIRYLPNNFLGKEKTLRNIRMDKLEVVENNFLASNTELEEMSLPSLTYIGNAFLMDNKNLREVDLPSAICVGSEFISRNRIIRRVNMPCLTEKKNGYLRENDRLDNILRNQERDKYILYLRPH